MTVCKDEAAREMLLARDVFQVMSGDLYVVRMRVSRGRCVPFILNDGLTFQARH